MSQNLIIYKASAGSGKTYTLTKEFIKLLLESGAPDTYQKILAATFTNKATAELKERILKELHKLFTTPEESMLSEIAKELPEVEHTTLRERAERVLQEILEDYTFFRIQTIDSFFQEVVRSFAFELHSTQLGSDLELDAREAIDVSVDRLLIDMPTGSDAYRGLSELNRDTSREGKRFNPQQVLSKFAGSFFFSEHAEVIYGNYDFSHQHISETQKALTAQKEEALKGMAPLEQAFTEEQTALQSYLSTHSLDPTETLHNFIDKFLSTSFQDLVAKQRADGAFITKSKYEQLEDAGGFTVVAKKSQSKWAPHTEIIRQVLLRCKAYILQAAPYLQKAETCTLLLQHLRIIPLMRDLKAELTEYQKEENILFIGEVNDLVRQIIDGSDVPFLYDKVGTKLEHYMIDEFQDTNRTQWDNFKSLLLDALATDQKSFLVGDVKQSIYRFRGADSSLLNDIEAEPDLSWAVDIRTLKKNWRSSEEVVAFNNAFFYNIYDYDGLYGTEGYNVEAHKKVYQEAGVQQSYKESEEGRGYVEVALKLSDKERLERLADLINDLQDPTNSNIPDGARPFAAGEIAILVRTNGEATTIAETLIEAQKQAIEEGDYLRAERLQFLSDEALIISQSDTVRLLIALFEALAHPGERSYQRKLEILLRRRGEEPALLPQLLELASGATSIFEVSIETLLRLKEIPEEEQIFVNAFLDQVYKYSAKRISTFGQFLEWWLKQGEAQKVEMGEVKKDAVTIITVHKAKGLEYPVVILPFAEFTIADRNRANNSYYLIDPPEGYAHSIPKYLVGKEILSVGADSDLYDALNRIREKEYMDVLNLLYVAFTRASQQLYIWGGTANFSNKSRHGAHIIKKWMGEKDSDTYGDLRRSFPLIKEKEEKQSKSYIIEGLVASPMYDQLELRAIPHFESAEMKAGTLLHKAMEGVYTVADFDKAITQIRATYRELSAPLETLTINFRASVKDATVARWFTPTERCFILTELSLSSPTEEAEYRPDRIVIDQERGEVAVIDYKFGEALPRHRTQVATYMQKLAEMGYKNIKGYLWYQLDNRVEVTL